MYWLGEIIKIMVMMMIKTGMMMMGDFKDWYKKTESFNYNFGVTLLL